MKNSAKEDIQKMNKIIIKYKESEKKKNKSFDNLKNKLDDLKKNYQKQEKEKSKKLVSSFEKKIEEEKKKKKQLENKFKASLKTKDQKISELENSLREKDQKLKELKTSLRTKDQKFSELENSLRVRDQKFSELENSLRVGDQKFSELENSLREKVKDLDFFNQRIKDAEAMKFIKRDLVSSLPVFDCKTLFKIDSKEIFAVVVLDTNVFIERKKIYHEGMYKTLFKWFITNKWAVVIPQEVLEELEKLSKWTYWKGKIQNKKVSKSYANVKKDNAVNSLREINEICSLCNEYGVQSYILKPLNRWRITEIKGFEKIFGDNVVYKDVIF